MNWILSKYKTCDFKDTLKKMKGQLTELVKIFANHISDKGIVLRIL